MEQGLVVKIRGPDNRGEYNVENLKLSQRCHKSCRTQPEGKKLSFIFQ